MVSFLERPIKVGNYIRSVRESEGITLKEVADFTGLDLMNIFRIERGDVLMVNGANVQEVVEILLIVFEISEDEID